MNPQLAVCFIACVLLVPSLPAAAPPADSQPAGPVVHLASGALRGSFEGGVAVFRGVPYAAPPIGDLRWRPPQPPLPWQGERDATRPGPACMQISEGLGPFIQPIAAAYSYNYVVEPVYPSEDCLTLNVWIPEWPARHALPVMLWIHGGSNTAGSGGQPTYDAASLASHGVIVVTINYRLGILGFFAHPALTAESPHHSSGNYGLLDQLAALQWVQANITQFGGDPANVTVFGESAGSIDAGLLITSPLAAHLFRRAILESGPPFGLGPVQSLKEAESTGSAATSNASIESLRKLSAADLQHLAYARGNYAPSLPVDGWIVPQPPAKAFVAGGLQHVDLIIGLNGRELSAFRLMAAAAAAKQPEKPKTSASPSDSLTKLADSARAFYGAWTWPAIAKYLTSAITHRAADRDAVIDLATNDMALACPIGALATLNAASGNRTFVYRFDRAIPGKGESTLGAFHGLEIPYLFNAFSEHSWNWLPFTAADHALSATIETYWTNFAKTGDPTSSGVPTWPAWQPGNEDYMDFTSQAEAVPSRGFAPPFCYLSPDRVREGILGAWR